MLSRRVFSLCSRVYTCTVRGPQPSVFTSTAASIHTSTVNAQQQEGKEVPEEKTPRGFRQIRDRGEAPLNGLWQDFSDLDIASPSAKTPETLVNGVKFSELPICHIKASKNNTHIIITDHTGTERKIQGSCGIEGFRNAKKKTAVAAQATAMAISQRALKRGVQDVRVVVKGFGTGREAAVMGIKMGGLKVVSLTDVTHWGYTRYRPRKQIRK